MKVDACPGVGVGVLVLVGVFVGVLVGVGVLVTVAVFVGVGVFVGSPPGGTGVAVGDIGVAAGALTLTST